MAHGSAIFNVEKQVQIDLGVSNMTADYSATQPWLLQPHPSGPNNNIPALVQIMAWRRPGDEPLSEPMMVNSLTHVCVPRHLWVNSSYIDISITRNCVTIFRAFLWTDNNKSCIPTQYVRRKTIPHQEINFLSNLVITSLQRECQKIIRARSKYFVWGQYMII